MKVDKGPRVIVALDFTTRSEALNFVEKLNPALCRLKVGITLFTRYGPTFVEALMQRGFSIFLDLKFHDVPSQVVGACRAAATLGVWMLTIHTQGGAAMCEAASHAIAAYSSPPYLIGVTALTSMDEKEWARSGATGQLIISVSRLLAVAQETGLDGVVCSPLEVSCLHQQKSKKNFLFVTPGIRLTTVPLDDQKRVATPQQALHAGADYLVMGRSITLATHPVDLLKEINAL